MNTKLKLRKKVENFLSENFKDISFQTYLEVNRLLGVDNELEKDLVETKKEVVEATPKKYRKRRVVLSVPQKKQVVEDYNKLRETYGINRSRNILCKRYNVSFPTIRNIIKNYSNF